MLQQTHTHTYIYKLSQYYISVLQFIQTKYFDFIVTDTTGCDCRDKLSDTNTVSYTVTYSNGTTVSYTFTSCTDLVDKAPQLCSSVRNNKCCDSCKGGMSVLSLHLVGGGTVAEWQHSRLPPLRSGFGSRLYLKWESW